MAIEYEATKSKRSSIELAMRVLVQATSGILQAMRKSTQQISRHCRTRRPQVDRRLASIIVRTRQKYLLTKIVHEDKNGCERQSISN
jgi:hypothetical protein